MQGGDPPHTVIERASEASRAIWRVVLCLEEGWLASVRAGVAEQLRLVGAEKARVVAPTDMLSQQMEDTQAELETARAE